METVKIEANLEVPHKSVSHILGTWMISALDRTYLTVTLVSCFNKTPTSIFRSINVFSILKIKCLWRIRISMRSSIYWNNGEPITSLRKWAYSRLGVKMSTTQDGLQSNICKIPVRLTWTNLQEVNDHDKSLEVTYIKTQLYFVVVYGGSSALQMITKLVPKKGSYLSLVLIDRVWRMFQVQYILY